MLEAFLRVLAGERPSRTVWTADQVPPNGNIEFVRKIASMVQDDDRVGTGLPL